MTGQFQRVSDFLELCESSVLAFIFFCWEHLFIHLVLVHLYVEVEFTCRKVHILQGYKWMNSHKVNINTQRPPRSSYKTWSAATHSSQLLSHLCYCRRLSVPHAIYVHMLFLDSFVQHYGFFKKINCFYWSIVAVQSYDITSVQYSDWSFKANIPLIVTIKYWL